MKRFITKLLLTLSIIFGCLTTSMAEIVKEIRVIGNQRISNETIIIFSKIKLNTYVDQEDLIYH